VSYLVISLVCLIVCNITLFSGFGLGTLLLPVFLVYFPPPVAIAATAIVHLANNVLKVILVGKLVDIKTLLAFCLPAIPLALLGAFLIEPLSQIQPLLSYQWAGHTLEITGLKVVLAILMALFAALELTPAFQQLTFPSQWIPLGGALSGFFGGLSGHQGALRSAFLIRVGLSKEVFIGTTVVSAVLIDLARLGVYGVTFFSQHLNLLLVQNQLGLILAGIASAFAGTFLGSRLLPKVKYTWIQKGVGVLLIFYALALGFGFI
jgi:uncharacterized membrane protein YfcA